LIEIETHLSALAGNPHFEALRGEIRKARDQKYALLAQAGQSHEDMIATAGEIRGMNLLLTTTTPKGQHE
jgi:hypothetical protein